MFEQSSATAQPYMPMHVQQQAAIYQLGVLKNVYKPRNPFIIIGITIGVIIADILLFALIWTLGFILYILFIIPIVVVVYCVIALIHSNFRVYEFAYGLIQKKGSQLDSMRWDQIETVWQNITRSAGSSYVGMLRVLLYGTNIKRVYTLRRSDGATFIIDSTRIHQMDKLGQTIQQEVARAHLPKAKAALDSGQSIPFGPLTLSTQGVANNNGVPLPWRQVRGTAFNQGKVNILQEGVVREWIAAPIAKVPNIGVFTELVNYASQRARER